MKTVAIIGASGIVGRETINVLYNRQFPIKELKLYSSIRSSGKKIATPYGEKLFEEFSVSKINDIDILFLSVSSDFSKKYRDILSKKVKIIIDNSSAFRLDKNTPLIVPEINFDCIKNNFIANPNCTTSIASVVLWPIYKHFGIKNIIISTYQAASGSGIDGISELKVNTLNMLNNDKMTNKVFQHNLPFNVIPHIDKFEDNNYTKEEMKVILEIKKIFRDQKINITCTAVRVPTIRAHAISVTIETNKESSVNCIKNILDNSEGVSLMDDIKNNIYPMPINSSNKYNVNVGRIRQNEIFGDKGFDLFICGDQILKGSALNAVQIAEKFI
jgi:aspartate-semialdehyde dehydrogenase